MESIKSKLIFKSIDQMKSVKYPLFSLFFLILLIPQNASSQSNIGEFETLTWSEEIKMDATYSWKINKLSQNAVKVDDITKYGIIEGMLIQIKVLVQLSEVNIIDFINETLELPNPTNYLELSVQGISINFVLFDTIVFIVPTDLTISEADTHSFFVLDSSNIVVFSKENEVRVAAQEYVEFDASENSEEFVWDLNTGLLKSIKINYTDGFEFDMTLENSDDIAIDEVPFPSTTLIFGSFIVNVIIRKRKSLIS
ncbi:MAG: hypothetical protein HeimC2_33160 [Candidatus Heimdallarchaeota archaeon LC_2]|nr:MAG: hypothetical protein HeimC2_35080 [Candidatus Heimdallarchaeota archaeon LC_2]OLS21484.1 MAG: hypothetical protein HeimC2_33160 [Candidatus Heimdallarchaeota archaeon LC_2]